MMPDSIMEIWYRWVPWGMCAIVLVASRVRYHGEERDAAADAGDREYHKWGLRIWGVFLAFAVVDLAHDVTHVLLPGTVAANPRLFAAAVALFVVTLVALYHPYQRALARRGPLTSADKDPDRSPGPPVE